MSVKCNGCSAVIYDILYMECTQQSCKKLYHLKCLALTTKQFEGFSDEYKAMWRCPECLRDVPKGNNADTPVRGNVLSKTFTPGSCYVTAERGSRITLDETSMEKEDKILEEIKEFRWEMKTRLMEQSKEYALLLDRFTKTESDLKEIKQSMEVVVEKANKVDLLEVRIKSLLEINAHLELALRTQQSHETKESYPVGTELHRSFANVVKQFPKPASEIVGKNGRATKPTSIQNENFTQSTDVGAHNMRHVVEKNKTEEKEEREGKWTAATRRKSKYSNSEVKRGGSTQTTELQGSEKQKFLHVWRLQKNTTTEILEKFVRNIIKDTPVKIEKIKHKTERDYASYIIGVPESKYTQLCQSEIWPINVEFCEWVWFRKAASHPRPDLTKSK